MHPEPDHILSRASANGSPIPCFNLPEPAGLPPHTPPSGGPLDRIVDRPSIPSGDFSPPVPQGKRGEVLRSCGEDPTPPLETPTRSIVLK